MTSREDGSSTATARDGEGRPTGRSDVTEAVRPLLRGVSHQYAFAVAVVLAAALVAAAPHDRARLAVGVFGVSVALMFGVSALYHRVTWRPGARRWMRRLDHAAIYLLIAGTYTPFGLLVLDGAWATTMLAIAWTGAAAAIALKLVWIDAPSWVAATLGILLGWVGVVAAPPIVDAVGWGGFGLLLVGGLFYTCGALVYALRRPDPVPSVFGYHELFHALVIVAAACQYAVIAFFVLPEA
jgi:hemolysin III